MKVYLNKEYKCVKVEDNTFVANDSSNYIRYYFVTNANGDVIDKMDDTSVIYRNTEPSYVTVAFRRADGDVIQHLMASPKTDATGNSFFEYEITNTDGVLYKKGALEISAQFIEATLSETGGVKKVISQKVKAIAINTAHVLDNIGEEAEEYYSQYEQANNDAHAVLQTQITTNFNNIGTLQELTTDAKDDLVKAINEVDAHADANKSEIGDLSTLTTDEKTTIVGAINEVDAHADANKAEIGNLSALTTDEKTTLVGAINEVDNHADNATTLANNAVATANGAVATANEAKTTAQTAENNANSAVDKADNAIDRANKAYEKAANNVYAVGFMTLQEAITAVNGYDNTVLKTNDNILVVAQGSPDLYVTSVEATNIPYNFTTVDKFNDDLVKNTVLQVGYYKVAFYETDGQPVTVAYQNVVVKSTDWVASTEFEDFPYEARIPLSNFVDYTTVPQVVFDIADTMSGNYAPICKSGDKCVYIYGKVQNEITLKTVITFAPNVNGASVTGGGYNNRGKWVASTTYAIDDLVYTDNGQYVCIEGITSTTSPEQDTTHWQATFVATGKTTNGLKFSGQNTDGSAVQKTFDGSQAVEIAFDENTMTAKEVDGVLKVGAKGTVPEALPQTAGALKSGEMTTSGWAATENKELYNGKLSFAGYNYAPSNNGKILSPYNYTSKNALRDWSGTIIDGRSIENCTIKTDSGGVNYVSLYWESGTPSHVSREIQIYNDGTVKAWTYADWSTTYDVKIVATFLSDYAYTISDADVTTNSDILMEITDANHIVPAPIESGKIKVIRDTVPTQAIPYTYKVKQTNASGQFTVLNHYVAGVTSVNGQTGAVTIAVPTKTSELENDSGYVSNIPIVRNVVCNDVDSATTLDTTITCEVGDLILAQIIVRSALTLPTDWTLLRTIPAVETTYNQTLSFAYKRATSTSETLTVTQATAGRIYTNLVRLSNAVSISYIQSCEKTGTGIKSISSTKPVTPNMVIWGAASTLWRTSSPYGNWSSSPSTLDYYSVPQATRQPRLGTFVDSSGAGERIFTVNVLSDSSSNAMMCGAVEIVGDEVARKGDIPTSVPVTYKKASGSLPTGGWGQVASPFWEGELYVGTSLTEIAPAGTVPESLRQDTTSSNWKVKIANGGWVNPYSTVSIDGANLKIPCAYHQNMYVYPDGSIYAQSVDSSYKYYGIKNITYGKQTYTITDADITANTSVKMYLMDEGGVKAYSKAVGSIQVIRDEVPTKAIPYEYEVEQTSAEGLFEVINAYVPAVPTKTSQLTNDSGFITAADIGNALYPVGSIYMSVNNTNPSTFFGGTWVSWGAGRVPVGVDTNDTDFATVEKTGGEKTHTLTVSEMPSHKHTVEAIGSGTTQQELTAFNVSTTSGIDSYAGTDFTGGGQAHNNLQPYITCYMWKRTE